MATGGEGIRDERITVRADEELRDLIPGYLDRRREDVALIGEALAREDFESIRSLGHKMKGTGGGYGFPEITEIGGALEEAAKGKRGEDIRRQAEDLQFYLDHIDIVYED